MNKTCIQFVPSVFIVFLLFIQRPAFAEACHGTPSSFSLRSAITHAAITEYQEFGGHRINAQGYLWKFGSTETESELLLDPRNGEPDAATPNRFAWRRVWEYWLTLDSHRTGEALDRMVVSVPGLLHGADTDLSVRETRLRSMLGALDAAAIDPHESIRQAAVRAAISDAPWSAVFISYVMHQAGLNESQFLYTSAHWQYIKRAFEDHKNNAYRACDIYKTRPQEGDLLCYSRGTASPRNYAAWREAVQEPGFSAASHCEVVVSIDRTASKMETIGGNVLQSVTMRRLKLDENGLLSRSHAIDQPNQRAYGFCLSDKTCRQSNLNLQQWSVLLQLQPQ